MKYLFLLLLTGCATQEVNVLKELTNTCEIECPRKCHKQDMKWTSKIEPNADKLICICKD